MAYYTAQQLILRGWPTVTERIRPGLLKISVQTLLDLHNNRIVSIDTKRHRWRDVVLELTDDADVINVLII